MALTISIQTGSNVSIYQQIVEQVCAAAYAGRISDDDPLPSVRALAEELLINPNTVLKAYGELVREGVIESRPGRGMFISKRRQIYSGEERARRIDQAITSLVSQAFMLGFSSEELVELVTRRTQEMASTPSKDGKKENRNA
jgi:GntR family transcriptional regulator